MKYICILNFVFALVYAEVTLKFQGNVEIAPPGKYDKRSNHENTKKVTKKSSHAVHQLVSQAPKFRATANYISSEARRDPEINFKGGSFDIFPEKRKVKDDAQFRNFIVHVYKQHLKVFKKIKKKVSPELKNDVEKITDNFRSKFIEFVNNTQNFNIKTKQASQKIVMNTIMTSNSLMKRLLDLLIEKLRKKRTLRIGGFDMVSLFKRKIVNARESEIQHACKKLGVCYKDDGYSQLVYEVFSTILRSNDDKIIQARNAFTEVLKDEDFTKIMDKSTLKRFYTSIENWELAEPQELRSLMTIIRNIIHNKYLPITVPSSAGVKISSISRTVGILELLDALDEAIPSTPKNKNKFDDLRSLVEQWAKNERSDIQDITRSFIKLVQKGIRKAKKSTVNTITESLQNIIGTSN